MSGDVSMLWVLFRESIAAAVIAGAVLGWLGVYLVLRRTVFMTAAITQATAAGIAIAHGLHLPALLGALGGAWGSAALLGGSLQWRRLSRDGLVGLVFIAAGTLVILLGSRGSIENHDIEALLFGSAVMVPWQDLLLLTLAGTLATAVQLRRGALLAFTSLEPEVAQVQGLAVRGNQVLLLSLTALMIGLSARALGALPTFALSTLPALAALRMAGSFAGTLRLAAGFGAFAGGGGFVAAWWWDLPVGATQAGVAALLVLATGLPLPAGRGDRFEGGHRHQPERRKGSPS